MDCILSWIAQNYIELLAASLGLIGIFLQIKQNPWYWFTSIIMVVLYIFVFYFSKFYADMSFQFYYLGVSIYGWYHWITGKTPVSESNNYILRLNRKQIVLSLLLSLIFLFVIYLILKNFTDSDVPLGDAFTTALSFTATWLLAKKYIENWFFWIVVNIVSTILYVYKGLYPTVVLFTILTLLAFVGYHKWKKFEVVQ
ncbi:MAG TPA: nicotinamide riboside transporter PnuC [Bacteroidales bacterium]|jgi:nicotinamide mononucleotide transporter|nr:nicotinamide riboside transporter PnuC [Bacteroidales bacterium]HOM36647.1 nicotinamide riboside transporter PnuC [Bacteroidales bacterium]HPD24060.1 nicotinamide riboside transporter PnuC [Bacteroidales bacterium]HRT00075.1 nicotinamide riboside transporter PnuC [Bacteroidales bacterium]HRT80563.1 nicotinamide riboside transporter PnuC [Bacteroidales bacterium]